jgi:nitrite reductase [NAD(P)H] small subunit
VSRQKRWIRITECSNIPVREGRSVRVSNREIAVFNLGERFLAVENHCPHRGGPLADGIISGNTVVCPLHAWKVDLETGATVNPGAAQSCLATFPTRVDAGVLLLELPVEPLVTREAPDECVEPPQSGAWIGTAPAASRYEAPIGND